MTFRITDTAVKPQELSPLPNRISTYDEARTELNSCTTGKVDKFLLEGSPLIVATVPSNFIYEATVAIDEATYVNSEDFSWDHDDSSGDRSIYCSIQAVSPNGYSSRNFFMSSNSFFTPISSPKPSPEKNPDTPEALKIILNVLDSQELGSNLTFDIKKDFTRAHKKINQTSPYKPKDDARKFFSETLTQTGSITEVPYSGPVRRRLFTTENYNDDIGGDWSRKLSQTFNFSFLDVKHLTDLEKSGGFHICEADHSRDRSVIHRRTNLSTGVWCGQVCEEGNLHIILKKFSSFVPRVINLEDYKVLISQALNAEDCKIAEQDNRRLYRVVDKRKAFVIDREVDENRTFVIECYIQEEGTLIKSAMPVFHYEVYNGKDQDFQVRYCYQESLADPVKLCAYNVVFKELFELLREYPAAAVYTTKDKLIVDVGILYNKCPKYGTCPIEKGLLVEIPKELL